MICFHFSRQRRRILKHNISPFVLWTEGSRLRQQVPWPQTACGWWATFSTTRYGLIPHSLTVGAPCLRAPFSHGAVVGTVLTTLASTPAWLPYCQQPLGILRQTCEHSGLGTPYLCWEVLLGCWQAPFFCLLPPPVGVVWEVENL